MMRYLGTAGAIFALSVCMLDVSQGGGEAPSPSEPSAPVNIVLITVDSLRSDRLDYRAGDKGSMPGFGALASRGIRFSRAYTPSPSTTPSNASILTGLYPSRHGLRHDLGGRLADGFETLAQRLQRNGYTTGAVTGSFRLDSDRGLDRGFGSYSDDMEGLIKLGAGRSMERRGDEVVEEGLRFLKSAPEHRPFFLWLNFHDPHHDYAPAADLEEEYKDDPYGGEVAHVDRGITALIRTLQARELFKRTHIILAGTHGEGLGEHRETGHGIYLYETTVRVPLILAPILKGFRQGTVLDTPVSLVDLTPTILDLAGIEPPTDLDGQSLLPLLSEENSETKSTARRRLFIEAVQSHQAYGWSPLFAVIEGEKKVVVGRWAEAFDLGADPAERRPITPLPEWAKGLESIGRPLLGQMELPEARRQQILEEALALMLPWDNSPICLDKQEWPDPRDADRIALNDLLFRARVDSEQRIVGRAARLALEVMETDPANFTALEIYLKLGLRNRWGDFLLEYLELFQCNYPFRGQPYHLYGHYLDAKGERARAEQAYRMYGRLEPWSEEAEYDLAALFAMAGEKEKAFAHLERAIALGSTDFDYMRSDYRLKSLREDPRYDELLGPVMAP